MRRVAVASHVLEFASDDPFCVRAIAELYHAATPTDRPPTRRYRLDRATGGYVARAPARAPFGPARLGDAWAFLEWRATEDLLLEPGGEVFLHAAGAQVHGRGVLLVGPSAAGKSTLAAHLLARGHPAWGDDLVLFATDKMQFASVPRSFKLDAKALSDIFLLAALCTSAAVGTFLAPECWYVSPAAVRRCWAAGPGAADLVVLLDGGRSGPPRLDPMSPGEAAIRVVQSLLSGPTRLEGPDLRPRVLEALGGARAVRAGGGPPGALAQALEQELAR